MRCAVSRACEKERSHNVDRGYQAPTSASPREGSDARGTAGAADMTVARRDRSLMSQPLRRRANGCQPRQRTSLVPTQEVGGSCADQEFGGSTRRASSWLSVSRAIQECPRQSRVSAHRFAALTSFPVRGGTSHINDRGVRRRGGALCRSAPTRFTGARPPRSTSLVRVREAAVRGHLGIAFRDAPLQDPC